MEVAAVSVGKAALNALLSGAKSTIAEESALTQAVQRDMVFLADELEEMQSVLRGVVQERDYRKVPRRRVKQLRNLAYDVEDCLQEYSVHLEKPSGWRLARTVLERHRIAAEMKGLRARVEDMNQRNLHHQLMHDAGSKRQSSSSNIPSATMFGIEGRRRRDKGKADLYELLIKERSQDLRVIAVWGTSGILGQTVVIKEACDDLKRGKKFELFAWIRIMHPFNPLEFLQCIMRQFYQTYFEEVGKTKEKTNIGAQVLKKMGMMRQDELVDAFSEHVNEKSYLIVLNDLSTIEEWDAIKEYFPDNKKGSRIIVSTEHGEVARFCAGQESTVSELNQSSVDQSIFASYNKGSKCGTDSGKRLTRLETTLAAFKKSQLIGREEDKSEIIKKISYRHSQEFEVISICGMSGIGKTTLVKHIYQRELNTMFQKHAYVTIKRPFNPNELLNSLATQLGGKEGEGNKLFDLLDGKSYLVILDDMASTAEWDAIIEYFPTTVTMSRIIVTTREQRICRHCSKKKENIYELELLRDEDAHKLLIEKVFGTFTRLDDDYPELVDETNQILWKCYGLPLAIVTMGGLLAEKARTVTEWRKFREHINTDLVINMKLQRVPNVLINSYEGLPYDLKYCFLYMSIFPENYNISRRRLLRRWIAEGYSSEVHGKSLEEIVDSYFLQLIDRSVILPVRNSIFSRKEIDSCQLHDLMREMSISRAMDEDLVFRLEEGSSSSNNTQAKIRHVAISSNWEGDKSEFESAIDLSHIRSLTVFGRVKPFLISDKMSLLRVLDLEGTRGLLDRHLEHIARLLHLKYICLRGCYELYHLPDSWGKLSQLQTLDMKGTRICYLPKTITNLTKLQYLFVGGLKPWCVTSDERLPRNLAKLCGACFAPKLLEDVEALDDPNWHDVCNIWCHVVFPTLASRRLWPCGVVVPRGVRKLKALRTLGVMNIAGSGKAILQDIRKLTQLRRLSLTGINHKNYEELCSTLAWLSCLESLSLGLNLTNESGLHGCLDRVSSPLKNMQSVKLVGRLIKLPEWIGGLHSLVKLTLANTKLSEFNATIWVLGRLPNLAILRLVDSFGGENLSLTFHQEAFSSLMVLQLGLIPGLRSVKFAEGATRKLELLCFFSYSSPMFSGLASLPRLKEFMLGDENKYTKDFVKDVRDQLAENTNAPILKF